MINTLNDKSETEVKILIDSLGKSLKRFFRKRKWIYDEYTYPFEFNISTDINNYYLLELLITKEFFTHEDDDPIKFFNGKAQKGINNYCFITDKDIKFIPSKFWENDTEFVQKMILEIIIFELKSKIKLNLIKEFIFINNEGVMLSSYSLEDNTLIRL